MSANLDSLLTHICFVRDSQSARCKASSDDPVFIMDENQLARRFLQSFGQIGNEQRKRVMLKGSALLKITAENTTHSIELECTQFLPLPYGILVLSCPHRCWITLHMYPDGHDLIRDIPVGRFQFNGHIPIRWACHRPIRLSVDQHLIQSAISSAHSTIS